jgi:hypothetical protein
MRRESSSITHYHVLHETKLPWTETSETMNQNKFFLP